ncbi:MAG: hypothetical protein ACQKBY_08375 [Verrucomicrobiales bacterium]
MIIRPRGSLIPFKLLKKVGLVILSRAVFVAEIAPKGEAIHDGRDDEKDAENHEFALLKD